MRHRRQPGQSILYAVLLMPTLFLVLALAIEMAALQLERLRLHYAVDLATLTGAGSVDAALYGRTGDLRLDSITATATTRAYLERNLAGLPDTPDAAAIAAQAEVAVLNQVPTRDPFTGSRLDRPSVCARIRVPHRFSVLGWAGLGAVTMTVTSEAEIRS